MTYRPDTFVIGYQSSEYYNVLGEKLGMFRFGVPSCNWLKQNKWTDLGIFSRHCGGAKPHQQRNEEIQLKKDLGLLMEEIDNKPVEGFRLVDINEIQGIPCAILYDPRGFYIAIQDRWLKFALFKHHASISSNGELSGKWFYRWKNRAFDMIANESEFDLVDMSDNQIDLLEKKIKKVKRNELEIGSVYDVYIDADHKTKTCRYVYLGNFQSYSLSALRNFVYYGPSPRSLCSSQRSYEYCSMDGCFLPWNTDSAINRTATLMKSKKGHDVFVRLSDSIQQPPNKWTTIDDPTNRCCEWYVDTLCGMNPSDPSFEHSLIFSFSDYPHRTNIEFGNTVVKRIVGKSEDQTIRIITDSIPNSRKGWQAEGIAYTDSSEYKTFSLEMLTKALTKWLSMTEEWVTKTLEYAPVERPKTQKEFRDWAKKMDKFRSRYTQTGIGISVSV